MKNNEICDFHIKTNQIKQNCFIYILSSNDDVVYVGQTTQGLVRPFTHMKDKTFDKISIIYCDEKFLNEKEKELIEKYNPYYNKSKSCYYRPKIKIKRKEVKTEVIERETIFIYNSLLDFNQLSSFLNIGKISLMKLIGEGLPFIWVGNSKRFQEEEVVNWLKTYEGVEEQ